MANIYPLGFKFISVEE